MAGVTQEFLLQIEVPDADSGELQRLARNLRAELLDSPVEDVEPVSEGSPPPGAKALDAFAWSALRLLLDPAILRSVFDTLVSWVRRNEGASLHLSAGDCLVELKGAALDAQALQKMLEACLSASTATGAASESASSAPPNTTEPPASATPIVKPAVETPEGPMVPEPPPLAPDAPAPDSTEDAPPQP